MGGMIRLMRGGTMIMSLMLRGGMGRMGCEVVFLVSWLCHLVFFWFDQFY